MQIQIIRRIIKERDIGGFMRLTTPFMALKNATSDIWRMHDFNYQLPKAQRQNYWEKECIDHPTSSHCKVY